jgi:hypothetical protein
MKTKPKKRFVMYLDESDYDQLALKAKASNMDLSPFAASILVPQIRAGAANDGLAKLLPAVDEAIAKAVNRAVFQLRKLQVFTGYESYVASFIALQVLAAQEGMTHQRVQALYDEGRVEAAKELKRVSKGLEGLLEEIDKHDPRKSGER